MRVLFSFRSCLVALAVSLGALAAAQTVTTVPGSPFPVVQDSETTVTSPDGRFLFTAGPTNRLRALSVSGNTPVIVGDFVTSCSITHGLARNPEGTRLYTVGFGSPFVAVHAISANGALSQMETEPLSTSAVGNSVCYLRTSNGDFVYVNENRNGANFVSCFPVEADGRLAPAQRYATGANSNGSGFFSSPRLAGNGSKGLLFVLNGSSVSSMRIGAGGIPNLLGTFSLPSGTSSSGAIATDLDGSRVFVGLSNGLVAMWQVADNGLLTFNRTLPMGGFRAIDGMQVHPSGRLLLTVDVVQLGITDLQTGQVLYTRSLSNCTGVEIDRFGKRLYVGTSNGTLPVFDFASQYWVQQPPTASGDSYSVDEDHPLSVTSPGVLANDSDANGDPIVAALVAGPAHGTLSLNPNGSFDYLPALNFNGTDSFTYKAVASDGESTAVTVTIQVRSLNDAPVADAGADRNVEATGPLTTVMLSGSASDVEGGVTTRWIIGGQVVGEAEAVNVSLPIGTTTATFVVTDADGATASDDVTITVRDTTAPNLGTMPGDISVAATSAQGAVVNFNLPGAYDTVDGWVPVSSSPASGSVFPFGKTVVIVTAKDSAGNASTASFTVTVGYQWSGLLEPVGNHNAKAGSTVPVKFRLVGGSAGVRDAKASLMVSGGVGGAFRYSADDDMYICNWSTKGLKGGSYVLKVDLGDGVERTTTVTLK